MPSVLNTGSTTNALGKTTWEQPKVPVPGAAPVDPVTNFNTSVTAKPTNTIANGIQGGISGFNASSPTPFTAPPPATNLGMAQATAMPGPAISAKPAAGVPTMSGLPAPTPTPAKPAEPAKPAAPNAAQQVTDEVTAGKSMMTNLFGDPFADGKLGRITDPRAADMQALLDRQKAGMDGMTPQEMQAAREQGMAGINQQLGTNMQQFGDLAAAQGVRGGAAMGLQMQALGQAQDASGQLSRQLILDNMNQKNIGMDRYGKTLMGQQGTELGIQDKNLDQVAKEKLGQITTPMELANLIDSRNSSNTANDLAQQSVDIAKDRVKNEAKTAAGGGTPGTPGTMKPDEARAAYINDPANANMPKDAINTYLDRPENKYAQSLGYSTWADMPDPLRNTAEAKKVAGDAGGNTPSVGNANPNITNPTFTSVPEWQRTPTGATDVEKGKINEATNKWMADHPGVDPMLGIGPDGKPNQAGCAPGVHCYVMTVAADAGLLDRDFYVKTVTKCPTKRANAYAYGVWGPIMASAMKRSTLFAKAITWLIPDTVKMLRGQPARLRGKLAYYMLYVPFCAISNVYLKVFKHV